MLKTSFKDLMPEIIKIVRDAIQDGLIRTERMRTFNYKMKTLRGKEREDYLQQLWDQL